MKLLILTLAVVAAMAEEKSVAKMLYDGSSHFTNNMFSAVVQQNPGKSVVMSGYSAMSPLAMLGLASTGESHDEILRTIGLPDDNSTKAVFSYATQNLRAVKGVELNIANRVFIAEGFELNEEFNKVAKDVFDSDTKSVNFVRNVEAADTINTWVEDNTNKRIKDLIKPDSLDGDTRAVLVNAIFFKGSWKEQFDPKLTQDRDFHVTKEKTVKVPTMYKNGDFRFGYSNELNAKLLELPYKGDEASFLIVLPNEIDGLPALEEKLKSNPELLENAVNSMYSTEVDVFIPKFKIETTIDLKETLQRIGVTKMFDASTASLGHLLKDVTDGLYISDAIQKAFIEVNEEGAEAAAASAYVAHTRSAKVWLVPRPTFVADRPFYFILKNKSVTLFNGVYSY